MLTYSLEKDGGESLYTQLYACIRRDILSGALPPRQKLPSKRALAQHLEVSVITVKNAYEQLAAEGYIYTVEKKGYYVSPLESPLPPAAPPPLSRSARQKAPPVGAMRCCSSWGYRRSSWSKVTSSTQESLIASHRLR